MAKQSEAKDRANYTILDEISIYSEHKLQVSVLNLTIACGKSLRDELNVSVESNAVTVSTDTKSCTFLVKDLELLPLSCRGLHWNHIGELQMTLQVKDDGQHVDVEDQFGFSCQTQDNVCNNIQTCQGNCFCVCCGQRILNDNSAFSRVLPLPSENWSDLADFWFCHQHGDDEHTVPSISPKSGDCLVGNLHVILSISKVKVSAVETRSDLLYCRRCDSVLGIQLQSSSTEHKNGMTKTADSKTLADSCQLYLHAIDFRIDGPSCNIPDISDGRRVEVFLSQLFQEQSRLYTSFRFLVRSQSGGGCADGTVQFLLWLVDQEVTQYTGSRHLCTDAHPVAMVGRKVTKILYRCVVNTGANNTPSGQCDKFLFRAWEKDNTVHGLTLPRPLCLQLAAILIRNTRELPHSHRRLNGFHVSYLVKDTKSASAT